MQQLVVFSLGSEEYGLPITTVQEIIRDMVKGYDYPVCYNFPVSHGGDNYALKHGMEYTLSVGTEVIILEE